MVRSDIIVEIEYGINRKEYGIDDDCSTCRLRDSEYSDYCLAFGKYCNNDRRLPECIESEKRLYNWKAEAWYLEGYY